MRMYSCSATISATLLLLAGCGSSQPEDSTANTAIVSEDPFGATGAPGADMTDNGVTDGGSGMADGNLAAPSPDASAGNSSD